MVENYLEKNTPFKDMVSFPNLGRLTLESGLQSDELIALHKFGRGFCSFQYLLRNSETLMPTRTDKGFGLYIASYNSRFEHIDGALEVLYLMDYSDAYRLLGVSMYERNHIRKLLERMNKSDRTIVFFIPPQAYLHPESTNANTARELQWYLDDVEIRADNTIFCFGMYETLPGTVIADLSPKYSIRIKTISDIYRGIMEGTGETEKSV